MYEQLAAGAVGAGVGAYGAVEANKATRRSNKAIQKNAGKMQGEIRDIESGRVRGLSEQYAPLVGDSFGADTQAYYDALDNADYSQFDLTAPEDFSYDTQAETQRFMNPMIQQLIDRSTGEVTNSAANAGKLFSGAAGKGIAKATAGIQAEQYDKAAALAQQDRTNKYQQWTDKFTNARLIAENNKSNLQAGLANKGTKFGIQSTAYGQQIGAQQGVQNAADTAYLQSRQQGYDAQAANKALSSNFMAGLGGAMSGATSAFGAFGGGKGEK